MMMTPELFDALMAGLDLADEEWRREGTALGCISAHHRRCLIVANTLRAIAYSDEVEAGAALDHDGLTELADHVRCHRYEEIEQTRQHIQEIRAGQGKSP